MVMTESVLASAARRFGATLWDARRISMPERVSARVAAASLPLPTRALFSSMLLSARFVARFTSSMSRAAGLARLLAHRGVRMQPLAGQQPRSSSPTALNVPSVRLLPPPLPRLARGTRRRAASLRVHTSTHATTATTPRRHTASARPRRRFAPCRRAPPTADCRG